MRYTIAAMMLCAGLPALAEVRCQAFDTPEVLEYVVKDGDTLGGIARDVADVYTSAEDLICINQALEAKVTRKERDNRPEPLGGPLWAHRLNPGDIIFIPICPGGCTQQYGVRIN